MRTPVFKGNTRLLPVILLCLICSGIVASENTRAESILVLGDSLSDAYGISPQRGWVNLLRTRLQQHKINATVINASASGETTRGGAARLPALLTQHKPCLVIIELGGNDGLRGISPSEIENNLVSMIEDSKSSGAKVLMLAVRIPPNYGKTYTQKFDSVFVDVSSQENVPLVPRFLAGVAEDRQLMQDDGIHPNAGAQPLLLENVWPELLSILGEQD